jgi:hypothetical protein
VRSGSTSGTPLITSSSITINDTSLYPSYGTLLNSYCLNYGVSPFTFREVRANGSGGTYNTDTDYSATCGYIAPGTLYSSSCIYGYGNAPYTLRNVRYYGPTAAYGTYNEDINNSPSCGWVQTYNESLSISPSTVSVSNYTTISISGGQPSASVSYATTNYGDPQPSSFPGSVSLDSSGNYSNYLTGGSITGGVVGDKTLWVYFPYNSHVRSARINVVPDAGQAVGVPYCSGTTRYQNYTDGSGGTYASVVEYYSTTCGWTPPTATWSVSYSNSGTSGNINVSVTVSLSGPTPTTQTFYFSGYVSQNGAGFNVPSVTINAGSTSGSGFGYSGFTNGTAPYSPITLIANVDTAPYTITPSSKSNSFSYSSTGVIQA